MTEAATETLAVIIEREMPVPAERVWRALTEPRLIGEWLMQTGFRPVVGERFDLRADWGTVEGEVLVVEPLRVLAYSWDAGELRSTVTWTLTPTAAGTRLRLEHMGFRADQPRYYGGARAGWPRFLDALAQVLARRV